MQPRVVQLFVTCLVDQFYPQVASATLKILEGLGISVRIPFEQTCCGQPAFNDGLFDKARSVARRFLIAFDKDIPIVTPSGSCAFMVRKNFPLLFRGEREERLALRVSKETYELTEFLTEVVGVEDLGANYPHRVTYHASCHMTKGLGLKEPPLKLLRNVRGLEFLEMENSDMCCGFGGVFSLRYPDISLAILEEKAEAIIETGAEVVTSADISCLMQIEGFLRRRGLPLRVEHIALILKGERR